MVLKAFLFQGFLGIFFVVSLGFSSYGFAQDLTPSPLVLDAVRVMTPALTQCPLRVWNQEGWQKYQVVFLDTTKSRSWLWNSQTGNYREVLNSGFSAGALGSHYSFLTLDGIKTVTINLSKTKDALWTAHLALHEAFHFVGQSEDWISPPSEVGRATVYPVNAQPRIYRRMMTERLYKYIEDSDPQHLRKARYWFERWQHEAPQELRNATDVFEATARYIDSFAESISILGCAASEQDLIQQSATLIRKRNEQVRWNLNELDMESYELGALAVLATRKQQALDLPWIATVRSGVSPLISLLKDVIPLKDTYPRVYALNMYQQAKKRSAELEAVIKEPLSQFLDPNYLRIPIKYEWNNGSFLVFESIDLAKYHLQIHIWGGKEYRVSKNPDDFIITQDYTPLLNAAGKCDASLFILIHKSEMKMSGDRVDFSSKFAKGSFRGLLEKDEKDFTYVCPR